MLNLDTHILIHALFNTLSKTELQKISGNKLAISDIVIWEMAKLTQIGRIDLNWDLELKESFSEIKVIPIDFEIARATLHLDFSSDPADELIAATSIVKNIPLLTRDKRIRKSKIVPLA